MLINEQVSMHDTTTVLAEKNKEYCISKAIS